MVVLDVRNCIVYKQGEVLWGSQNKLRSIFDQVTDDKGSHRAQPTRLSALKQLEQTWPHVLAAKVDRLTTRTYQHSRDD